MMANLVVMITGAAGNLGAAVAHHFDAMGANLVLLDLTADALTRTFGEAATNPRWLVHPTNITDEDSIEDATTQTLNTFGRVDVLVNIAGGFAGGKNILETSPDTWERMMNLNAKSVFLMSRAVVRVMMEQGNGGRIINIGAKPALMGTPNQSAYAASKAAVLRLTESMAAELRPHQINVNAVIPSVIDTPANRQAMPTADFGAWVAPQSLAAVIGFLAGADSRDITGAAIPVYGG